MTRLIDVDAIKYDLLPKIGDAYEDGYSDALADIRDAPTVDAVPVIRCKDCWHYDEVIRDDAKVSFCRKWYGATSYSGHCHKAEKKEGEEKTSGKD